ncbi:hypothetical protein HK096_004815 [Nowakowskiella sp. JEL0078]|nr:hypothetical protein HK096_004815 [Nowakowskiella sp. JEL0078]
MNEKDNSIGKVGSKKISQEPLLEKEDHYTPYGTFQSYKRLFRYSTSFDIFLIVIGVLACIGGGSPLPILGLIFGDLLNEFAEDWSNASPERVSNFLDAVNSKVLKLVAVATANFVLTYIYSVCWSLLGERLTHNIRIKYVEASLKQNVQYVYDCGVGQISNSITGEIQVIHNGTSEKVGLFLQSISYFIIAFAISFTLSPKLSAAMCAMVPAFLVVTTYGSFWSSKYADRESDAASRLGTISEEAFSSIRMIQSFCAERLILANHRTVLTEAKKYGDLKSYVGSLMNAAIYFIAYGANALAFWYGAKLMLEDGLSGRIGSIFSVILMLVDSKYFFLN